MAERNSNAKKHSTKTDQLTDEGNTTGLGIPGALIENSIGPDLIPDDCPLGLEFFINTNRIIIQQLLVPEKAFITYGSSLRYHILDQYGRRMYHVVELATGGCVRGASRPWTIALFTNTMQLVLNGYRTNDLSNINNVVTVKLPNGQHLGNVVQVSSSSDTTSWMITDAIGKPVLGLGSAPSSSTCGGGIGNVAANFALTSLQLPNGQFSILGRVSKFPGGYMRERYVDADNFGIDFPLELDPKTKAVLLFATFMINFMFYQSHNRRSRHFRN